MNRLRRYSSLPTALLLTAALLVAQSLLFWHTHDTASVQDIDCQVCMHAQQHTPVPSIHTPVVYTGVTLVETIEPVTTPRANVSDYLVFQSRAPPVFSL